jgi:alpha-L-fucosidase 2
MKKAAIYVSFFILASTLACTKKEVDLSLKLWYTQPANNWNEALPLGNGRFLLEVEIS